MHLSSHLFLAQKPESFFLALGRGFSAEPSQLTTSKRRRSCSASSFPTTPALLLSSHTFLLATGSQTHDLPFTPVPRFFWFPKIANSARKEEDFFVRLVFYSSGLAYPRITCRELAQDEPSQHAAKYKEKGHKSTSIQQKQAVHLVPTIVHTISSKQAKSTLPCSGLSSHPTCLFLPFICTNAVNYWVLQVSVGS